MPTVNIYLYKELSHSTNNKIKELCSDLKPYIAQKLSCNDINLTPEEVSLRIIRIDEGQMIAPLELEVTAHAFPERIENMDSFCRDIAKFIKERIPEIPDVQVWLKLHELGHSWEE